MRGKLPYVLSIADYYDFLDEYKYYKRSVTEQVLYLDPVQQQKIMQSGMKVKPVEKHSDKSSKNIKK